MFRSSQYRFKNLVGHPIIKKIEQHMFTDINIAVCNVALLNALGSSVSKR